MKGKEMASQGCFCPGLERRGGAGPGQPDPNSQEKAEWVWWVGPSVQLLVPKPGQVAQGNAPLWPPGRESGQRQPGTQQAPLEDQDGGESLSNEEG